MNRAIKTLVGAAAIGVAMAAANVAFAASIEGKWSTKDGRPVTVKKCGSSFCLIGSAGQVGKMKGSGNNYRGTVTDPANGKTYSGKARVSGNTMKVSGCVLGVLCRSETWRRR